MILGVIGHEFAYEMECVTRLFFPGRKLLIVKQYDFTQSEDAIITRICENGKLYVRVRLDAFDKEAEGVAPGCGDAELERGLGLLLFGLLAEKTGRRPAWGILTGIRPVRLYWMWREKGLDDDGVIARLEGNYLVSREKAELCVAAAKAQEAVSRQNTPDTFSLYVGIPFCPTRCLYCSFVSHAIDKAGRLVPEYVEKLCAELGVIAQLAAETEMKLLTVYIGGGTPTALDAKQLERVLFAVNSGFDVTGSTEFTVEAGRPDTITREKLELMRGFGVNRVSVNPQSMNGPTLDAIGRSHTPHDASLAMKLARDAGFSNINMDLIAGLPGETAEDFGESLDKVIGFTPENITVHTLSVKRSSHLRERSDAFDGLCAQTGEMHRLARRRLEAGGYFPYYLYRQKAAAENLENTGFSRPGYECAYNIHSMGDSHNILAAGAGGISKLMSADGVIRRVLNYKYPYEYIGGFNEIIKRKGALRQCVR